MKIKNIILMLFCIMAFSACENNVNIGLLDSTVYLVKSGEVTSDPINSLDSTTFNYNVYAHCSGFYAANVLVKIDVDTAALDAYNTENGKTLVALPANCYTIINNEGKISKENRSTKFVVKFNCDALKLLGSLSNYVLPVSIKTEGSVAVNEKMSAVYIKPNMIN